MGKIITTLASIVILGAAYILTFGAPMSIQNLLGLNVSEEQDTASKETGQRTRGAGKTTVVMESLEAKPYTLVLRTIGTAKSARSVDIVSSKTGEVSKVMLAPNSKVQAGDLLVQLDDRTELLALNLAKAENDQAQEAFARFQKLKNSGNLVTTTAVEESETAARLAKANLDTAETELEGRKILATIDGTLGLSDIQPGDYLTPGDAIVTIDDSSEITAEFEVPERSIALLSIGKTVLVGTPTYAGRVFKGEVIAFDTKLDSTSRSATVQAQIDNPDGALIAGMTFAVRMIERTDPLPVVPATAITWGRGGASIWVSDEGEASKHGVAIRYRSGEQVWVETDVDLGSMVITEGAPKLRPGSRVAGARGDKS
ncbi:MAG: efflux RND transporter periplasmic adaptor subunit [Hyphomicrobiales bacterium]